MYFVNLNLFKSSEKNTPNYLSQNKSYLIRLIQQNKHLKWNAFFKNCQSLLNNQNSQPPLLQTNTGTAYFNIKISPG